VVQLPVQIFYLELSRPLTKYRNGMDRLLFTPQVRFGEMVYVVTNISMRHFICAIRVVAPKSGLEA
jgi:hypothetical protein